ncbi:MAG: protein kinase [Alphaproteobacteria bacterium]|nr:protein kinase [Alphaproteobacteria bacterium]
MAAHRLGAFELRRPVGRGGNGQVWAAVHERSGRSVAVKVLTATQARRPEFLQAFHEEVATVARLCHPYVVQVLDSGIVPDAVAGLGPAVAGSPWLAMELARGTLRDLPWEELGWDEILPIATRLLSALGHAHAVGVVHLDLKPANVLIGCDEVPSPGDPAGGLRLADFGASQVEMQQASVLQGTPLFMAPEQFRRDATLFGPPTDLYAFGCVLWQMVTGRPPFDGSIAELGQLHLHHPPPAFTPRLPVPQGLEPLLRSLLGKRAGERPAAAGDVVAALARLGDPVDAPPAMGFAATDAHTVPLGDLDSDEISEGISFQPPERPPPAPIPERWEDLVEVQRPWLVDVGSGLLGRATLPMVGRLVERDALWAALRRASEGRAEVVTLTGEPGVGRSRLARWLAERAGELGAARTLVGTGDLRDTLLRGLRVHGEAETTRRLASEVPGLDEVSRQAVARWLADNGDERPPVVLGEALVALARERVLAVVVDEADAPTVAFARALAGLDGALLVVLAPSGGEVAGVELAVAPLPRHEMDALLRGVLQLAVECADRVVVAAEGRPADAVSRVVHAFERGRLRPGPFGFDAVGDDPFALPPSGLAWSGDEQELAALRRAAVLGLEVDRPAWRGSLPAERARDLVARLVGEDRARWTEAGWAFTSPAAREALVADARERGELVDLHAAWALELVDGPPTRRALHLVECGRPEEALDLLLAAPRGSGLRELREQAVRSDLLRRAAEEAGIPASDDRWGRAWFARVLLLQARGRRRELEEATADLRSAVTSWGWTNLRFAAELYHGVALRLNGHVDRAWEILATLPEELPEPGPGLPAARELRAYATESQARALVDLKRLDEAVATLLGLLERPELDDHRRAGSCSLLAQIERRRGRADEALAWAERAVEAGRRAGGAALTYALVGLCEVQVQRDDRVAAERSLREGYDAAIALGKDDQLAPFSDRLGDLLRYDGRLAEAELWYRRSDRARTMTGMVVVFSRINLACVMLESGEPARARELLLRLREDPEVRRNAVARVALHATLMASEAALGDWGATERWLDVVAPLADDICDVELARYLDRVAWSAREAGRHALADRATAFAAHQWSRLG